MITVLATGDLVLEREDTTSLFQHAKSTLLKADVVVGHLEVPHTTHTVVASTDVPALPAPPSALTAVADAGFDVLTLAGNHVFDFGPEGIRDTKAHCADLGIATVGAGENIDEAWLPFRHDSTSDRDPRLVVLSVNCVGPRETWAGTDKPGCAYVEVISHYEQRGANPGGPARAYTFAEPRSLASFCAQVKAHVSDGTAVIVALHKGLVHTHAEIADYEKEISHAAIDAGASAVIGHHAHIFKGIEMYRGRPIFHGLGNFVTVTNALGGAADDTQERRDWAQARKKLFGFEPDPTMPEYPFHPESRNTGIAVFEIHSDGSVDAGLIPCWIDDEARPVPQNRSTGTAVLDYIKTVTQEAGFATDFNWISDELVTIN